MRRRCAQPSSLWTCGQTRTHTHSHHTSHPVAVIVCTYFTYFKNTPHHVPHSLVLHIMYRIVPSYNVPHSLVLSCAMSICHTVTITTTTRPTATLLHTIWYASRSRYRTGTGTADTRPRIQHVHVRGHDSLNVGHTSPLHKSRHGGLRQRGAAQAAVGAEGRGSRGWAHCCATHPVCLPCTLPAARPGT